MRVTLIGPVYPFRGGIAHHTTLLSRHLTSAGHQVQLVSFRRQYPRWLVRGRSDRDPSNSIMSTDALYALDPLNPLTWWRVGRLIQSFGPDIVILQWWVTYWSPAWYTLTRLIRRWTMARIVFLCHNVLPHESSPLDRILARTVLRQGDSAIVHAQQELEVLARLAPDLRVVHTPLPTYAELGEGSDRPSRLDARALLGLHADQPVLLFFGFVRPYKGLEVLLAALAQVRAELPVHLLIVGEVWSGGEALREQVRLTGLDNAVTFVDRYIPNEELPQYFAAADAVVLPYLTATQSAVVQVAYGFGVPVIASSAGGLPDVVEEGRTGLLTSPNNPPALADAILRYFREDLAPHMKARIAELNGGQDERFSWKRMIDTIERLATGGT